MSVLGRHQALATVKVAFPLVVVFSRRLTQTEQICLLGIVPLNSRAITSFQVASDCNPKSISGVCECVCCVFCSWTAQEL